MQEELGKVSTELQPLTTLDSNIQSCGLEDNEYFYKRRDLDIEELFGREYNLLEERDAIDDLD